MGNGGYSIGQSMTDYERRVMKDRIKGDGRGDKRGEGEWKERRKLAGYESCHIFYL